MRKTIATLVAAAATIAVTAPAQASHRHASETQAAATTVVVHADRTDNRWGGSPAWATGGDYHGLATAGRSIASGKLLALRPGDRLRLVGVNAGTYRVVRLGIAGLGGPRPDLFAQVFRPHSFVRVVWLMRVS